MSLDLNVSYTGIWVDNFISFNLLYLRKRYQTSRLRGLILILFIMFKRQIL